MRSHGDGGKFQLSLALPALFVSILVVLPFINTAFTIDDVTFLLQARQALVDPLHPTAFEMVADGERIWLADQLATGPVMAYLLVPAILSVSPEIVAHATQIVFASLATIATASLALQLGLDRRAAAACALLVATAPPVLVMMATAMPDIPAMALGVAGIDRFVAYARHRRLGTGILAAVLLTAAGLSRPHAMLLIPLATLFLLSPDLSRKPEKVSGWIGSLFPLLLAAVVTLIVIAVTKDPGSGTSVAGATLRRSSAVNILSNLPDFPVHWVLAFPLAFLWPVVRGRAFLRPRRTAAAALLAFALGPGSGYFTLNVVWAVLLMIVLVHGIDVLLDIGLDAWRRGDRTQFALFVWMLIPAATATYVQLPSKLLILSAPAAALLVVRRYTTGSQNAGKEKVFVLMVACSIVLGIMLLRANYSLGEIGRDGGKVVRLHTSSGNRIWADGAWGFQWYAMEAGAIPLAASPPYPTAGDLVVTGIQSRVLAMTDVDRTLLSQKVYDRPGGRVHGDMAGFFTNHAGPLPWAWGTGEYARIEVWRLGSEFRLIR